VFVIMYILAQFATGCFFAVTLGMGTGVDGYFDSQTFFDGMSHPGAWYRIVAILIGGSACANSDFLASCAMSRLPFAVVVPVFMGWSLVQATVLNYFIESSDTDPYLLFAGIFAALLAIACMALSDIHGSADKDSATADEAQEFYRSISRGDSVKLRIDSSGLHDPLMDLAKSINSGSVAPSKDYETTCEGNDESQIGHSKRSRSSSGSGSTLPSKSISSWIYVSMFAGFLAGIWSPLQVFGRDGSNSVDNPSIILFFFQLGEVLSIPFILYYHGRVIVVIENGGGDPVSPWTYVSRASALPTRDKMYGCLAGCIVACGQYIFFIASEVIPSTIAFAISSCAPLVTIALGIFVFHQLHGAPFLQSFFIMSATIMFILAIVLMVLADLY
jgi:glucose uptake protein GlcU